MNISFMYATIEIIAAMSMVFFALAYLQNSQRQTAKKKTTHIESKEGITTVLYHSEPSFIPSHLEDVHEDAALNVAGQPGSDTRP